jgi:hypothetical protein
MPSEPRETIIHERPPCFICQKREAEPGQILCGVCIEWAEAADAT